MATKKAAAKKSASKSSTTRKRTADSPARKRSGSSKSTGKTQEDGAGNEQGRRSRGSAPRASAARKRSGPAIAGEAAQQLMELTGRDVEGVTGLQRSDDGWTIQVEVLEVRRIPDTTDVLALYELSVDDDGGLEGYRRLRRYVRGTPGEESG